MQSRLDGILGTQTLFGLVRSRLPCIICASRPRQSSRQISIRPVSASFQGLSVPIQPDIDDAPRYRRGNRVLVALVVTNIFIYLFTKIYFVFRNARREQKWGSMSEEEKVHYVETTKDEGNKRLDFRLAH